MTPLLSATLAYATGLLAGLRWTPGGWLAAGLLVAVALALRARPSRGAEMAVTSGTGSGLGPLVAFCAAGLLVGGLRGAAARQDCRALLEDGAALAMQGVATALPAEGMAVSFAGGWNVEGRGSPCRGVVRLRAAARHAPALDMAAREGRPLAVFGRWLRYPHRGGWPRPPVYAGSVVVDSLRPLPDAAAAGRLVQFRIAQQARLRGLLPQRWGLAEALLLAQKSGLSQETRARWVAAGLVHLLAISGMHVGLIAGGVLLLASALGLPRRTGRRAALLLTAAYVLFLGAPSAALRALLQAALLLVSLELQRPAEPFTLLATAALGILLLEPMALLDPGFQLSFAGMIGLIGWRRPVAALLPRRLPAYVRDGIAAGAAASALTTPIAALHFGQASWVGIPGSLVAVPLLATALAGLLVALLVAALTGATTGPHALLADVPLRLLEWAAELGARVPGGHGYIGGPTVLALLAAVAAAIVLRRALAGDRTGRGSPRAGGGWLGAGVADAAPPPSHAPDAAFERHAAGRRAARLRRAVAVAGAIVVAAWAPRVLALPDTTLAIHAIDVGQGDAFAIRTPRGRWILVDAGPRSARSDAGRDRVVPFLLRHGARRIEALILTHPDADHIGGAAAVLDAFDVGLVIDPGLPAGKDIFIDLLGTARRGHQRWIAGRAGIAFRVDGVDFTLLYPWHELDGPAVANDFSVVFRMEYGGFAALFLGDAPSAVEDQLVARHGGRLRAAVLKVGHHGSSTSTSETLLNATRPEIALVSAGRRNRYGHPAPVVVRRLERHNVRVLRTDELGTITVRATRAGRLETLTR
jgi:competence protein ComEC